MTDHAEPTKRRPGRPKTSTLVTVTLRLSPEIIADIDRIADSKNMTRAALVKSLVGYALTYDLREI